MKKVIAVDFDGTLCTNKYPDIGEPNSELIEQLIEEQKSGTVIILWSCRGKQKLNEAVAWSKKQGLKFDYVNRNSPERVRIYKGDCRKISADIYIDDRSVPFEYGKRITLDNDNGGDENDEQ